MAIERAAAVLIGETLKAEVFLGEMTVAAGAQCIELFAMPAARLAKCPLGPLATSRFIVATVSKAKIVRVQAGLMAGILPKIIFATKKCLALFAMPAARLAKCPLGPLATSRFIAAIALARMPRAGTKERLVIVAASNLTISCKSLMKN